jgi:hypothetical protein
LLDVNGTVKATAFSGPLTGNVTGNATGNAGTATILETGRTIALTGDVTGTTESFNGSANVSAATTIASNAVTTAKIADSNVTDAKLASGIDASKLTTGTLPIARIADAAVTPAKLSQPLTVGTFVSTTSGTNIDFTGIPSWARRITISFYEVSTNGTSVVVIRVGDGSILTSGYAAGASYVGPSSVGNSSYTSGFGTVYASSGEVRSGSCVLTNIGGNTWVASGTFCNTSGAGVILAGSIVPSGTLDRVRVTTVNGTDTFDGGGINIMYEG